MLKRSGGCTQFTSRWLVGPVGEMPSNEEPEVTLETLEQSSVGVLLQASRSLAGTLSRRAAYDICRWMPRLPPRPGPSGSAGAMNESEHQGLLRATIARELRQHLASEGASDSDTGLPDQLAETLVSLSGRIDAQHPLGIGHTDFIANALTIAEFFAREGRSQRRTSP